MYNRKLLTNEKKKNDILQQLGLLRDAVLHGGLPGDPGFATEADEEHRRRARRPFPAKGRHVAGPFFPLGVLPRYVDPRGLRLHRGLLNGARSTPAIVGLHPLRVYILNSSRPNSRRVLNETFSRQV